MILLDTHVWIWWVNQSSDLSAEDTEVTTESRNGGLGVSAISTWEVAKLVERGRLRLDRPVLEWIRAALLSSGVRLLELSPQIAVESTQLPPPFHRDPADQIIVATARIHDIPLVTHDLDIRNYAHVRTLP